MGGGYCIIEYKNYNVKKINQTKKYTKLVNISTNVN